MKDVFRRAVVVVLVTAFLVLVPGLAQARFSSSKAPTLAVGTAKLVTPTAVTGTYTCRTGFFTEGADIAVTALTADAQPGGVSYVFKLYRGETQRATATSTSGQAALSTGLQGIDITTTTYRLSVETTLGAWTVKDGEIYTKSFRCGTFLPSSGKL